MQNFKLLFSVAFIVAIFGYAHGQINYKKLRKEAADCIVGESRVQYDGCNWCECFEKGVMICTRKLCRYKPGKTALYARPAPYESSYQKGLGSTIKLEDWSVKWKKFFKETASCKVGEQRRDPDDCNWCECIIPGSMICDTNKKCSKKSKVTLSASSSSSHRSKFSKTPKDLQRWKTFSEAAASCTVGETTEDPDGCKMCNCIENGVMVCSRMWCGKKTGMIPPSRLSQKKRRKKKAFLHNLQSLKEFAENAAECTVGDRVKDYDDCNWCECVETGVMLCSRMRCVPKSAKAPSAYGKDAAMVITASNSKQYQINLYNLRDKTKDCLLNRKTISTPCHVCKCIHHGAIKCVSVKGSSCDKNKKLKKNPKSKLDLPVDSDYLNYM